MYTMHAELWWAGVHGQVRETHRFREGWTAAAGEGVALRYTRPAELSRGSSCRQMTSCLSRWSGVTQIISSNDIRKFFSLYNLVAIFMQNQSCKWPDFCPA